MCDNKNKVERCQIIATQRYKHLTNRTQWHKPCTLILLNQMANLSKKPKHFPSSGCFPLAQTANLEIGMQEILVAWIGMAYLACR